MVSVPTVIARFAPTGLPEINSCLPVKEGISVGAEYFDYRFSVNIMEIV